MVYIKYAVKMNIYTHFETKLHTSDFECRHAENATATEEAIASENVRATEEAIATEVVTATQEATDGITVLHYI